MRTVTALKLTTLMVTRNMQHAVDFRRQRHHARCRRAFSSKSIGERKRSGSPLPELIGHFAVKTDRMLLVS